MQKALKAESRRREVGPEMWPLFGPHCKPADQVQGHGKGTYSDKKIRYQDRGQVPCPVEGRKQKVESRKQKVEGGKVDEGTL
ncbi:MAG: hypothetical protein HQP61_11095 [Peptococcaceae bacterium]|nr:hypothetical protein [Candidatus Syntrophopropionicum ammoniitolerans]